ncbi:MAG: ABC transporter substrate-binding protein [Nocardioides sp.]|uniref:ABC transporter substrate-binding protein n=1 Tax=Nocardioides sp. TaxID=35761 RepID=UPI0039E41076
MPRPTLRLYATTVSLLLVSGLTACSTDVAATDPSESASSPAASALTARERPASCDDWYVADRDVPEPSPGPAAEKTVDTGIEKTTVPANISHAVGFYPIDIDMLLTLGIPLKETQPKDDRVEDFPCYFPHNVLGGLKLFNNYPDFDYDTLLLAKPDFILNSLGGDKKVVKRLPEIAPTYSYNFYAGYWMDSFEKVAEDLGRTEEYDAYVATYKEKLAQAIADIKEAQGTDDLSTITVAPVDWYWGDNVQLTCLYDNLCTVLRDLGLTVDPLAEADDLEGTSISAEQFGKLSGIDYAFYPAGEAGFVEKKNAELAGNSLWTGLPFVKDDHIAAFEYGISFGGPSGQLAFLEIVRRALTG